MLRIAPQRYQSASGALKQIGEHLESLGERALVIGNKSALDQFEDVIRESLKESMIGISVDVCLGQCCLPEIERLVSEQEKQESDIIVGIGAGNTLDVAKYVAERTGQTLVLIPTVASSCAAFTNFVHLHSEDGEFIKEERIENCPDLVVVDYKIVGRANSRYLVAGMGSALASWYEFNMSREELELNQPRQIAYELAGHINDVLLGKGDQAVQDVKKGEMTSAVESVVEINILEAGLVRTLGGTTFRAMISHHLAHELLPFSGEEILFGEVVSFGVLVQEMMSGAQLASFRELLEFYRDVDLPLTLDSLELPENQRETILEDATEAIVDQLEKHPTSFEINQEELLDAISEADKFGQTVVQSGVDAVIE